MLIRVVSPMVDFNGRSFRNGDHRTVSDEDGAALVAAGHAQRVLPDAEHAAALLKSLGGGLLVLPETDPEMIAAAKAENLKLAKAKK